MKLLITLFISFLCVSKSFSQADLAINLLMFDNAISPYNQSIELTFGLDSTATDGLDIHLGEDYLPPDGCCGLAGPILCGAFQFPVDPNSTFKDFRFGELPYTGVKEHKLWYCSHSSSTVFTIQCNLPLGVSAVLQDLITGTLVYIEMIDSNEYYIYDPYIGFPSDLKLTVTYNNVVPIELTSFTASLSGSSVELNWSTATETNNLGFEILRKVYPANSGTQNDNEWITIGFISGFGTITEPKSYSFKDENIKTGFYKYRLKQIDYDGTFEYSNEVEIEVNFLPKEFMLYQNYPNPFNPTTKIKYEIPITVNPLPGGARGGLVTLKVFDILGNEIATLVNEEKPAGVYEVEFNPESGISHPASGVYFYQLRAGSFTDTKKLILIK